MALDAATIKTRLAAVSSDLKDNEAQNIVNAASSADLKGLDVEAVLRLYEALCLLYPRVYSARDKAAMKRLANESRFQPVKTPDFGVDLVKAARPGHTNIQVELTPDLVKRIYAAENKRLSWYESIGFDGDTIGRGQLGQTAYLDVKSARHFKAELEYCMAHVWLQKMLSQWNSIPPDAFHFDMSTYTVIVPANYSDVWREPIFEDFVVAAYLAIKISDASKGGRSSKDAARFGVAVYHGMRPMVVDAQKATGEEIRWDPIEARLKAQGHADECDYVNEVVK